MSRAFPLSSDKKWKMVQVLKPLPSVKYHGKYMGGRGRPAGKAHIKNSPPLGSYFLMGCFVFSITQKSVPKSNRSKLPHSHDRKLSSDQAFPLYFKSQVFMAEGWINHLPLLMGHLSSTLWFMKWSLCVCVISVSISLILSPYYSMLYSAWSSHYV